MALGSVAQKCIEQAGECRKQCCKNVDLSLSEESDYYRLGLIRYLCAGQNSSEPPSRWKRLLVGIIVIGAVGAAGTAHYTTVMLADV